MVADLGLGTLILLCHALHPQLQCAPSTRSQGMQFYEFIFLARSWASDRLQLSQSLSRVARRAEEDNTPFTLLLYPEGTLVSKDTRPLSKKFAEKEGIVRGVTPLRAGCPD